MWPSMMAARSTCSLPSRRLAPWGSAFSRCSAPETPVPYCASCQPKTENLAHSLVLVWPTGSCFLLGLEIPTHSRDCVHMPAASVNKHPHLPTLSLFSQILRPQLASSFHIHSQSRIHSSPRPLGPLLPHSSPSGHSPSSSPRSRP